MALRFATAAFAGISFGGFATGLSKAQAKVAVAAEGEVAHPLGVAPYYHEGDEDALDIKGDMEAARRADRKKDQLKGVLTKKFMPLKLGEVINLSEETAIFRFLLPKVDDVFVMQACSTLQMQHKTGTNLVEQVQRMYTPITPNGTKGFFDILVKRQTSGRMTEALWGLSPGETMNFRIVMHKLRYFPNVFENVGMIGTGSGITPLLQVVRASMAMPEDKTKFSLLFANPTDKRVLLKGTLDDLVERSKGRFKAFYTVDKVVGSSPWQGFIGLIDTKMIAKTMPPPGKKNIVLVCGSDSLLNSVCGVPFQVLRPWSSGLAIQPAAAHGSGNMTSEVGGMLGELGYQTEHVYRF